MKRLWFAGIFLLICAALCVIEQVYIKNFCLDTDAMIEDAIVLSENGGDGLKEKTDEIKNYWDKNNNLLFMLTNHGELADLSADIRALDENDERDDLREIRARLKIFYENQRISPANIF